jgi:hypothetical protein
MNKLAWLQMMQQDLETAPRDQKGAGYAVLGVAMMVLSRCPDNMEMPHDISVLKIYDNMKTEARRRATGVSYDFTPHVAEYVAEQLGVEYAPGEPVRLAQASGACQTVNLEDFI